MDIRVSTGSAVHLGLRQAKMLARPTTIYTMLGETCLGACRFCTQSRHSTTDRKFLSRVVWPQYDLVDVLARIEGMAGVGRLCIQTLKYPGLQQDLLDVVPRIHAATRVPISVCMNPTDRDYLVQLKEAGVERVGVGLDCATQEIFEQIKPGFSWTRYMHFVEDIAAVFGSGSVHLIVGLGDTDVALVRRFQACHDAKTNVALFAYTPVRGTRLGFAPPPIARYRALQLARYLIVNDLATLSDMIFQDAKLVSIAVPSPVLDRTLASGHPFRTSGCPGCNRPLYNERPGGVMYNFPRPLTEDEKAEVRQQLQRYLVV